MIQPIDSHHYGRDARWIKVQVSKVLTQWGLIPRFKRWRLTQDPGTGMVVLFGILNNKYIASHTSIPFSDYFDPSLLHDLANVLHVQVVSCDSGGLRYAFILDRGSFGELPPHVELPFSDGEGLLVGIVYSDKPLPEKSDPGCVSAPSRQVDPADSPKSLNRGVETLLKTLDNIKLKIAVASKTSSQELQDVVFMDREEFNKQAADHLTHTRERSRLRRLLDNRQEEA